MTPAGRGTACVALLALASGAPAAAPHVRVDGDRVSIAANATPLGVILDELARGTGMQVVYESAPPSRTVTAALQAASHAEAVVRLFEGLAVDYAVLLDSSGRRVVTLWVASGADRARARPARPPSRNPVSPQRRFLPQPETDEPAEGEEPEPPESDEAPEPGEEPEIEEPPVVRPPTRGRAAPGPTPLSLPLPTPEPSPQP